MSNNFAVAGGRHWLLLALLLLAGLTTAAQAAAPSNDNFAAARLIVGPNGSTTGNTTSATQETSEPTHVVATATSSVWFRWTAPTAGTVTFTTDANLVTDTDFDTVLAVYTGSTVSSLVAVASNNNTPFSHGGLRSTVQFNVQAGQVYRIALAGVAGATGNYKLLWNMGGYAGTFMFTTALYEASEREADPNGNLPGDTSHNINGARITITRRDGFSGRVLVKYRVSNTLNALFGTHYRLPAGATEDASMLGTYTNSVVFDDWQASASFLVLPIDNAAPAAALVWSALTDPAVNLSIVSAELHPGEATSILPPKVLTAGARDQAILRIYDTDNGVNFQKTRWQISESAAPNSAIVRIPRGSLNVPVDGNNSYEVNGDVSTPSNANTPNNNAFRLAAGSDYAKPTQGSQNMPDFDLATGLAGTISWPAGKANHDFVINMVDDDLAEFNEDFTIELFNTAGQTALAGQNRVAYVAIVADDRVNVDDRSAGSVDSSYNRDYFNGSNPPFNATPGANDQVHAVAVDTNQFAVVGGDFTSMNTFTTYPRLARLDTTGAVDPNFVIGTGPNASVLAIKTVGSNIFIGGKFSSYNSTQRKGVAKVLYSGQLDPSFNPQAAVADPAATPVRSLDVYSTTNSDNGKVLVAGDFTQFNGIALNRLARLNSDGTLDTSTFSPGTGANGPIYAVKIITGANPALNLEGKILIAGDFTTYNGVARNRIARLNANGSLDTSFNPGAGANATVYSVDFQPTDGAVVIGGDFTMVDLQTRGRIARLLVTGQLDQNFDIGIGADDTVYSVIVAPVTQRIIFGGLFRSFNQVRRAGYARLLPEGYLDTSFMDTAYNHFAGLHMRFSPLVEAKPFVRSMALQANQNIIIGGSFQRVGGGYRNTVAESVNQTPSSASPWRNGQDVPIATPTWISREDLRNRANVARILGGETSGPGNIGFTSSNYSLDEGAGQLFVTVSRENANPLGLTIRGLSMAEAQFETVFAAPATGLAQAVADYNPTNHLPRWSSIYAGTTVFRMVSEAATGANNVVLGTSRIFVSVVDDSLIEGDELFPLQLTAPKSGLYLGGTVTVGAVPPTTVSDGETIPVGIALGRSKATVQIIDNDFEPTFIGFSKPRYSVNENGVTATVDVVRTGSSSRSISVDYLTSEHLGVSANEPEEAAATGVDFTEGFGRLTFAPGQTTASFTVPITDDVSAETDESINLYLLNLSQGVSFSTAQQTISGSAVDDAGNILTLPGHGFYNDTQVRFVSNGTGLPLGITPGQDYYVVINDAANPDTFQISLTPGGAPFDFGSAAGVTSFTVQQVQNFGRLVIYDNDFAPGVLRFSSSTKYVVNEGAGSLAVTVERTGGNTAQIAVDIRTQTVGGGATSGVDFTALPTTTLTWNSGDSTSRTVLIPITSDLLIDEPGGDDIEEFEVILENARRVSGSGAAPLIASPNPIPVHIVDDDEAGSLGFALNQYKVSEAGGKALVTVLRSNGVSGTVSANYATAPTGTARPVFRVNVASGNATNVVDDANDTLLITRHGLANGTVVRFVSGTPPPTQTLDTDYLVFNATTDSFQLKDINDNLLAIDPVAGASALTEIRAYFAFNAMTAVSANEIDLTAFAGIFAVGDRVRLSGTMPTLLTDGNQYYLLAGSAANKFRVSNTPNGAQINITPGASGYCLINKDDHYYVHATGLLNLGQTVTSELFPVTIIDNVTQNSLVGGSFNRTLGLTLFNIVSDVGGVVNAVLQVVDDENINEPAGSVDTTYNSTAGPDGTAYALALLTDERLLVGGDFATVNGLTSPRLARLKTDGQLDSSFNVGTGANDTIRSIVLQEDGRALIAGLFTSYNGFSRSRIARINVDGTIDTSFDPGAGADNPIYAMALVRSGALKGKIMIGGAFSSVGGATRPYVARLDTNGVVDQTFSTGTGPNGTIYSVAVQDDGKVIIGGDFTTVNLQPAPYLARLNIDGSLDTSFTANIQFNGSVRAVTIQRDGKLVVGGYFTLSDGMGGENKFITRLNSDGTIDTNFIPQGGGDTPVLALALQLDGKILVGGDFQQFSGVTRRRLTRLNPDGTKDVNINFGSGANNFIAAIVVQPSDERIIVGGGFTQFNGLARNYLARIYGGVLGGKGALDFALPVVNVSESRTNLLMTVRRTGGTEGVVRVNYATRAGTASEFLSGDGDYYGIAATSFVEFPAGETEKQINLDLNQDSNPEGTEFLDLVLSTLLINDPFYAPLGNQPETRVNIQDNDSEIAFGQIQLSVSESDASGRILVGITRSFALEGTITVRLVSSNVTASAGSDYTAVNQLVTFQPNETLKNVAVTILPDLIEEGNETFRLYLQKNPLDPDGQISTTANVTEVTIVDDDFFPGTVQFSSSLYTVDENVGFAVLTLVRTNGTSGLITVNYQTFDVNDAVGGSSINPPNDFIHTNGTVAFGDGESVKTIRVPILSDSNSTETNEIFQVNLSAATGGSQLGFPNPATVSIANNNSAIYGNFTIVANATVTENGPALEVSVVLNGRATPFDEVRVNYDTLGLTAVSGIDFERASGTLVFNNGMATETQTFVVNILDDLLVEDDETFQIVLNNAFPVGGPAIATPSKLVTIQSEDSLPGTIVFTQPQFVAAENGGQLQIVLARTNGHTGSVEVDIELSDLQAKGYLSGSAAGFDFTNTTIHVTWADGDRANKTNFVNLINDSIVEADEGFLLQLDNIINGTYANDGMGDIRTALGVILDDELKSGSIDPVFTAQANGPILSLAVNPTVNQGEITVAGDFTAVDGVARVNVAQISIDGTLYTGFDAGAITLGGTAAVVRATAVYTNGNNAGKVLIVGRFDSVGGVGRTNIARLNNDGSLDLTFDPGRGANAPVNALIIQADGNIVIGGDFNQIGTTSRNFIARVRNDGSVDTTFNPQSGANGPVNALALQSDGGILVGGDFSRFNGVISPKLARLLSDGTLDTAFSTMMGTGFDNTVYALAIQSDQSGERILVGGGFTTFNSAAAPRLTRLLSSGAVDTGFNNVGTGFNDSVFAITLQGDKKILVGGNFTSFKGVTQNRIVRLDSTGGLDTTMNFGSGADSFVSSIAQQTDGKVVLAGGFRSFDDQVHQYIVRLNNGTNTGVGVLQFASTDFSVYENGGSVALTVKRILGTEDSLSVDVQFVDGTAVGGVNYLVPTVTRLTFAEGETVKNLIVNIPDDPGGIALSPVRTFTVRLANAVNNDTLATADLISSQDEATVAIVDNETVIEFQNASFVVAENGVSASIVINRSGGSNDPVSITFQTTVGTATEIADYTPTTNTVSWAANDVTPKTVVIPVNNDTLVEGIETVGMQLSGFAGSVLAGTVIDSVLSILDNDFSSGIISFESATYNVIEGLPAQIVVVRTNGSSGIVSTLLTVSNNTAFAGADYLATNILVTFANGESRKVVSINTKDDSLQDDGETFLIHLSNFTGGAAAGLVDAAVIIDDNDVTIGFESAGVQVEEGDTTLLLNVTRSGLLTRTFIVDYATANVTAQAGLDYVQTNGVIVFGPDETNKVVAVQVKDDFVIEGAEAFTVNVSGANLSLLGLTQTTITVNDNDLSTDLAVQVSVNNPINVGELVRYSLLVTNYGPSDISGVTLTNILPASLTLQTVSVPNVTVNGNTLIFDLPVLAKNTGYAVDIEALDTLGTVRTVQNITSIGLPVPSSDFDLSNNSVTNVTTIAGPRPYLAVDALALSSEVPGPANGAFDINEQVTVNVTFRNVGETSTSSAVASLAATGGVVLHAGPQTASLGALAPNGTASRNFTFTVAGTNGGTLRLTFNLTDTGGVTYDPAVLSYRLGGSSIGANTNAIIISQEAVNNAQGDATPYPSVLQVSGLVGIVDQVSLTISNFTHEFPGDVDMILVSPAGQAVKVMSDAGSGFKMTNVTFTISDSATMDLPNNNRITNGLSYRPRDYVLPGVGDDTFNAPAPAEPYFSSMAAFRGIDPNGLWHLYIRDDSGGDAGAISNGWSLNITTVFPANPTAGLTVTGTQTAGPLLVGADQVYTIVVTNRGPFNATGVFLTNTFSAPFTVVSAVNSVGGAATFPSGRVILSLGNMASYTAVTNVITVRPAGAGSFSNLATAGASVETDSFLGDNTLLFTQIIGANADLAVGVTTSPIGTVALGNNLTYNISLTNLGPSSATSVVLTNVLPAGVNYVSGSASQGVVSRSGSLVTATLGSLAAGSTVQLTIIVTPTAAGSLTNSVTAASAVADGNAANNVAVATSTAVTDSADLLLALSGAPDPVTLGGNITYSISVTNRGPSTATGVTVTNPLPSSVTLVSFSTPYGTATSAGGAVVFTLGSVPMGTNVTMQVVVTANTVGVVNNSAFVTGTGTFDPVTGNNIATIATAVQNPSADIDLGAATLLSESITPSNGAIDPGESVTVSLELVNKGAAATANLVATLLPTGGVVTNSGPQVLSYGAIASGAAASRNFTFSANGNLGDTLSVTLQLQDGAANLGTVTFTFQLGETKRVNNAATIAGVDVGPSLTYPSLITVSGLSGTVLKATVTLSNVSHTFPDDFDILLVGPTGKKVLLVSDVGGGFAISGVNITLDDNAGSSLPDSGTIADGVYKPSNYLNAPTDPLSTNDVFDAPAPAGPYAATLADFVGSNPNGEWRLYVLDDQAGNVGSIGGWSLSLVTVSTLSPSADVVVTVAASPEPVPARSNLTYTVTVTNRGPNAVSGVTVSNAVPAGATLQSLATLQGTIGLNGSGAIIWNVGSLAANAQYQAVLVMIPQTPGSITNVTTVNHADIELNSSNNTATTVSAVSGFVLAGGSISVSSGNVSLTLIGQPGVTYIVESSTDLVNWVVVSTQSSSDGIIVINDPAGSGSGLRFYRARQQ